MSERYLPNIIKEYYLRLDSLPVGVKIYLNLGSILRTSELPLENKKAVKKTMATILGEMTIQEKEAMISFISWRDQNGSREKT